jgi:hypothetical protein
MFTAQLHLPRTLRTRASERIAGDRAQLRARVSPGRALVAVVLSVRGCTWLLDAEIRSFLATRMIHRSLARRVSAVMVVVVVIVGVVVGGGGGLFRPPSAVLH